MSEVGHNSAIAVDRVRSFLERIERLEEEKAIITSDIREVWAEAKAEGFSVKSLRRAHALRKLEKEDRDMLSLYCDALGVFG